jgi:four helix bundle protein
VPGASSFPGKQDFWQPTSAMRNLVAANYRAVCRSRSRADFISKISIVIEETDETIFWLELLMDTKVFPECRLKDLLKEANELLAIFGASQRTCKAGALLTN